MEKEMTVREMAILGGAKRWQGKTAEEKSAHCKAMIAKRWKGHVAKRPSKKVSGKASTGEKL